MQRTIGLLAFLAALSTLEAAGIETLGPRISIAPMASAAAVTTLKYVGDVGGISTDAVVSFELLPDYVLAAGLLQNRSAKYSFTADLVGDSGFGTILDLGTGKRWQIKIQILNKGFALISNPLGPGAPSTYYFKLVESR